jgi:hypothetical protein
MLRGVAGGTRIIVILQTNAFAYELKRQKNSWGQDAVITHLITL